MDDRLHIIITGDRGKVTNLSCSRKKLRTIAITSAISLLFLASTSIFSISIFTQNHNISKKLISLQEKLDSNEEFVANHTFNYKQQQLELDLRVAKLQKENAEMASKFKAEKEELLANAVSELNERNEIIEKIIGSIGIKLPQETKESSENSGGPFITEPDERKDEIIFRADELIKSISYLPFGRPVNGIITSRFGKRIDPVNGKKGFHTGLDFRGKRGDKIYATADGVVKKAFKNGGYGNYVVINHGNGYSTSFAHMQAFLVKKGERVERGQIIGLIGNTGRSTGPHLHYEVLLDKKPVNPYKFMKLAKLTELVTSSLEKK